MPSRNEPAFGWRHGARRLLLAIAALTAALGLWLGGSRKVSCHGALESPETQVRKALAAQHPVRLDDVYGSPAGGSAELSVLRYADILSSFEGNRATVVALLEAQGRVTWRDESAELSYLGREKFHMRPCSAAVWCAEGDQFARLRGLLLLLLQREDAFNARNPAAYVGLISDGYHDQGQDKAGLLDRLSRQMPLEGPVRQRILAWQIRVDRDGAEVGEDYLVEVPARSAQKLRARYTLGFEGDRWMFRSGL